MQKYNIETIMNYTLLIFSTLWLISATAKGQTLCGSWSIECSNITNLCQQLTSEATKNHCEAHTVSDYCGSMSQEKCDNNSQVIICREISNEGTDVKQIALIALAAVLAVLLGIVTICWMRTYKIMKKRMRASTSTAEQTNNSLTSTDTNKRDFVQSLCFQNEFYEPNSPSAVTPSPTPECPETNIYDLPIHISPAPSFKEKPKIQEALPKGNSLRYKSQDTLPKGSIRYTANKQRVDGEEGEAAVCHNVSECTQMDQFEFSASVDEQQWVPVTEYEVPVTQQETQN